MASAYAQDPRATPGQAAARAWLRTADRGDAAALYKSAGERFRKSINAADWARRFSTERSVLGPVTQRALIGTSFEKSFPGVPPGDYLLLEYRTAFAKKVGARETVTLERERDAQWRVVGYFIR